jgi:hypothetical protein
VGWEGEDIVGGRIIFSMAVRDRDKFLTNIRRGRRFEKREKCEWIGIENGRAHFEVFMKHRGKVGRIDIRIDELEDFVSVVEIKATDWNKILPHRIRPTALRHARQQWRYIEKEVDDGIEVCPGLVYPQQPSDPERKNGIEEILNSRMIQVVWRKE